MPNAIKREGGNRVEGRGDSSIGGPAPRVSVITVVKNGSPVVADAIDSVLNQSHGGVEHVIADGGSQDGTVEILRGYGSRIDYWVSEPDAGIAAAFNKGIRLTRGEIIGILNADDLYRPDTIARVVAAFDSEPDVDVVCGSVAFRGEDHRLWVARSDPSGLSRAMTVQHPATFVRRRRYEQSGLFRPDFECAMDYELLLRFRGAGARFLTVREVLAEMRLGGRSNVRWLRANYEVARAQRLAGASAPAVALGYCRRLADHPLRRLLFHLGLPRGARDLLPPSRDREAAGDPRSDGVSDR